MKFLIRIYTDCPVEDNGILVASTTLKDAEINRKMVNQTLSSVENSSDMWYSIRFESDTMIITISMNGGE